LNRLGGRAFAAAVEESGNGARRAGKRKVELVEPASLVETAAAALKKKVASEHRLYATRRG
jgi:hypothetical protein